MNMTKVFLNFTGDKPTNYLELRKSNNKNLLSQPVSDSFANEKSENTEKPEKKEKKSNKHSPLLWILGAAAVIGGIVLYSKSHKKPESETVQKATEDLKTAATNEIEKVKNSGYKNKADKKSGKERKSGGGSGGGGGNRGCSGGGSTKASSSSSSSASLPSVTSSVSSSAPIGKSQDAQTLEHVVPTDSPQPIATAEASIAPDEVRGAEAPIMRGEPIHREQIHITPAEEGHGKFVLEAPAEELREAGAPIELRADTTVHEAEIPVVHVEAADRQEASIAREAEATIAPMDEVRATESSLASAEAPAVHADELPAAPAEEVAGAISPAHAPEPELAHSTEDSQALAGEESKAAIPELHQEAAWVGDRKFLDALELPSELESARAIMEPHLDAFRWLVDDQDIELRNAQGELIGLIRKSSGFHGSSSKTKTIYHPATTKTHVKTEFTSEGNPKKTSEYAKNGWEEVSHIDYGSYNNPMSITKITREGSTTYDRTRNGWYRAETTGTDSQGRHVTTKYRSECPDGEPEKINVWDSKNEESVTTLNYFDNQGRKIRFEISGNNHLREIHNITYLEDGCKVIEDCDSFGKPSSATFLNAKDKIMQTLHYPIGLDLGTLVEEDLNKFKVKIYNPETEEVLETKIFDTKPGFPLELSEITE